MQTTLTVALLAALSAGAWGQPEIPLAQAQLAATHETVKSEIAKAVDGDPETVWAGDGHPLPQLPTNIIIRLTEPLAVGRLDLQTDLLKGYLRLTDLEVYAQVEGGWALLSEVKANAAVDISVPLGNAPVQVLRLRVRDTARPDHAFPRVREMRLFAAEPGAEADALQATPIADESRAERLFLQTILGGGQPLEKLPYDPAKGFLNYVRECSDVLIAEGTEKYGDVHSPMLLSILDTAGHEHPNCEIPPVEGQRQGDRALFGGNLQHDVPLLQAWEALSELTGEERYRQAGRDYLRFFLDNCTGSATGLWPWGEHGHWDFYKEAFGHTTHEYLGAPPLEFWERAWEMNPRAVLGEADGLLNHVVNLDTFEFNRHADISAPLPTPRAPGMDFLDFPRHGGFYIQVWAFAYSKTKDARYTGYCERMMDHYTRVRHPQTGLLPVTSSSHPNQASVATQLSLAVSMMESVPLLQGTPTGERCNALALEYLESLAALPHDPEAGRYCSGGAIAGPDPSKLSSPGFAYHYGSEFLAMDALLWCQAYRLTGKPRYLQIARGIAEFYAKAPGVPLEGTVRAQVFGSLINLMVDMDELAGGEMWLAAGERFGAQAIEELYHNGLFRGATGLWYYESESWPSTLMYALLRLHAAKEGTATRVPPEYFHR